MESAKARKLEADVTNPTVFKAVMMLFPEVARRVKDRFAAEYTDSNFTDVMSTMFARLKTGMLKKPGNSPKATYESMLKALQTDFRL